MKNLNEYPTPITDFVFAGWIESHPAKTSHAKLERKLAACREFILDTAKTSSSSRIRREASQAFTSTAP